MHHKPNFKSVPQVPKERVHKVIFSKYAKPNSLVMLIVTPCVTPTTAPILEVVANNIAVSFERSRVNNNTTAGKTNWHATIAKGITSSGTARSSARIRPSTI